MLTRHSPSKDSTSPDVWGFYEKNTGSIQYLASDPSTRKGILIDVVQNFDPAKARTSFECADAIVDFCRQKQITVERVLDTHPHADHVMASAYLKEKLGVPNGIGEKVQEIAALWRGLYNLPAAFEPARDFDHLFHNGETFALGDLEVHVLLSPGHTLGSVTYVVGNAAFVHDTLMFPDMGSSRADFPGGDAAMLWDSIQEIFSLAPETRLFVGHDYGTGDRDEIQWEATVAEHRRTNVHVRDGKSKQDFIKTRTERDATLSLPDRMLHALQINLGAGRLPPAEDDGQVYLKIPVNRF